MANMVIMYIPITPALTISPMNLVQRPLSRPQWEQRYWVHLATDRFTGQVIDKQIEVVNE